jgi:Papain-like cysteine protease AvrRpt2
MAIMTMKSISMQPAAASAPKKAMAGKAAAKKAPPKSSTKSKAAAKKRTGPASKSPTKMRAPGVPFGAAPSVGNTPYHHQREENTITVGNNWCWAACAQMISQSGALQATPSQPSQTAIVTNMFGSAQNFTAQATEMEECYNGNGVRGGGTLFGRPLNAVRTGPLPTEADLFEQVRLPRQVPVQIGYVRTDPFGRSSGHVLLVVGVHVNGGPQGQHVYQIHDPEPTHGVMTFDFSLISQGLGMGSWQVTLGGFR